MKLRTLACLIGAIAISSAPFVLAVTGGGFPSSPQFQAVTIQDTTLASGVTKLRASNGGASGTGDSEVLINTGSTGDAYVRTTTLGVTNWSAGNQRSSGKYLVCNAVGMSGTCSVLDSSGQFTSNSITASNGNLAAIKTGGGVQVSVQQNDAVTNGVFAQGDFCNSVHCYHSLMTGTAQSTAFITNGFASEAAYSYTDAGVPICIGTNSNCRIGIDGSGAITTPGATSAALPSSTTIGGQNACLANGSNCGPAGRVTLAWSGTCSGTGCITGVAKNVSSVTRNSAGNYTVNETSSIGSSSVCTVSPFGSVNAGLFMHMSSVLSSTVNVLSVNSAGTQTETNGFSIICMS